MLRRRVSRRAHVFKARTKAKNQVRATLTLLHHAHHFAFLSESTDGDRVALDEARPGSDGIWPTRRHGPVTQCDDQANIHGQIHVQFADGVAPNRKTGASLAYSEGGRGSETSPPTNRPNSVDRRAGPDFLRPWGGTFRYDVTLAEGMPRKRGVDPGRHGCPKAASRRGG